MAHQNPHGCMSSEHRSSQHLATLTCCCRLATAGLLFALRLSGPLCPTYAQHPQVLRYKFAIGDPSWRLSSGTLWLYSYSWYGLQSMKLAEFQSGVAEVPLDTEKIRRELNPHPNTDAYVVVLQLPNKIWFRSPDISPESMWSDFTQVLKGLGQTTTLPDGTALLILPALDKRRITPLHEDGQPVVKVPISVSIYLYDRNHCGSHTGLPLGDFVTDGTGTVEVTTPLVPLFLDNVIYYERGNAAPVAGAYELNVGLKLGAEHAVVARKAWNFPGRPDLPEQQFEIRVFDLGGKPLPNVRIAEIDRANTCGAVNESIGETDSSGTAHIRFVPQIVDQLDLFPPKEHSRRELSADELQQLFAKRTITVRW